MTDSVVGPQSIYLDSFQVGITAFVNAGHRHLIGNPKRREVDGVTGRFENCPFRSKHFHFDRRIHLNLAGTRIARKTPATPTTRTTASPSSAKSAAYRTAVQRNRK